MLLIFKKLLIFLIAVRNSLTLDVYITYFIETQIVIKTG